MEISFSWKKVFLVDANKIYTSSRTSPVCYENNSTFEIATFSAFPNQFLPTPADFNLGIILFNMNCSSQMLQRLWVHIWSGHWQMLCLCLLALLTQVLPLRLQHWQYSTVFCLLWQLVQHCSSLRIGTRSRICQKYTPSPPSRTPATII
jgi:hypothetical protein